MPWLFCIFSMFALSSSLFSIPFDRQLRDVFISLISLSFGRKIRGVILVLIFLSFCKEKNENKRAKNFAYLLVVSQGVKKGFYCSYLLDK